jgi:hypothetical protein
MNQSLPAVVWIFYIVVPVIGILGTAATIKILNSKEQAKVK